MSNLIKIKISNLLSIQGTKILIFYSLQGFISLYYNNILYVKKDIFDNKQ